MDLINLEKGIGIARLPIKPVTIKPIIDLSPFGLDVRTRVGKHPAQASSLFSLFVSAEQQAILLTDILCSKG